SEFAGGDDCSLSQDSSLWLPVGRKKPAAPRRRSDRGGDALGKSRAGDLLRSALPGDVSPHDRPRGRVLPGGVGLAATAAGVVAAIQSSAGQREPGVSF